MAKECRGFMNWDRRYVAVVVPNDVTPDDTSLEQSSEGGEDVGLSSPVMRQAAVSAKYSSPQLRQPPVTTTQT
jgi:hypothetical protein